MTKRTTMPNTSLPPELVPINTSTGDLNVTLSSFIKEHVLMPAGTVIPPTPEMVVTGFVAIEAYIRIIEMLLVSRGKEISSLKEEVHNLTVKIGNLERSLEYHNPPPTPSLFPRQ